VYRENLASYDKVLPVHLHAGLRAELEQDFQPLLSRAGADWVAHLEKVAQYLSAHGQRAEAAAIYLELRDLDTYRARSFQEQIAAMPANP
jgi:hypothetical protein